MNEVYYSLALLCAYESTCSCAWCELRPLATPCRPLLRPHERAVRVGIFYYVTYLFTPTLVHFATTLFQKQEENHIQIIIPSPNIVTTKYITVASFFFPCSGSHGVRLDGHPRRHISRLLACPINIPDTIYLFGPAPHKHFKKKKNLRQYTKII